MADTMAMQMKAWSSGIGYELDFWDKWMESRGLSWPEDFTKRFDLDLPLEPRILDLIDAAGDGQVRILDVGSGPVTNVGRRNGDVRIALRACDPLAHQYDALLAKHGLAPPTRTEFAVAEELSAFFEASSFDVIHCRNALDHSFDPIRALVEMLKIVRPGGTIMLRHHENEAEREDYAGFHQFNFDLDEGRFVIWNKSERHYPDALMPIASVFETDREGSDVIVTIRKVGEFPRDSLLRQHRGRLTDVYAGVIGAFAAA
jgi:SAM-dependent methyltransferase